MISAILRHIYDHYDSGYSRRNALFALHRRIIKNRWIVRALFGLRVDPAWVKNGYFDLTTLLLKRELSRRIRTLKQPRLLEIGVGRFAVLSGALRRLVGTRIVALDFDPVAVDGAKHHVAANRLDIEVLRSDVLGDAPDGAYDLIFWNLPYYDDPVPLLTRLFAAAPDYMAANGRLVMGFNSQPLPVDAVQAVLSRYPALQLERIRLYRWNRHALLVIRKTS